MTDKDRLKKLGSPRQLAWPQNAARARQDTETAGQHGAELLRQTLARLHHTRQELRDNPRFAEEMITLSERDIAFALALFADIQKWMVQASIGRVADDPPSDTDAS